MQAENIIEGRRLSSRWRILCLLFITALQVSVIWRLVEEFSTAKWTFVWLAALLTASLLTAAYDIVTRGTLTRKTFWWAFLFAVNALVVDISKLLNHSLAGDPFSTIFFDAFWIVICIVWIRRNPFETKTSESIKSSVSTLRD